MIYSVVVDIVSNSICCCGESIIRNFFNYHTEVLTTLFEKTTCYQHLKDAMCTLQAGGVTLVGSVRNEGGLGVQDHHKARGISHKKDKYKLGGPIFYRCIVPM